MRVKYVRSVIEQPGLCDTQDRDAVAPILNEPFGCQNIKKSEEFVLSDTELAAEFDNPVIVHGPLVFLGYGREQASRSSSGRDVLELNCLAAQELLVVMEKPPTDDTLCKSNFFVCHFPMLK